MTINYTTLLALAKPVTGTETGQWGDVVNDQITSMLEDAVANAATFSVTSGNVTLTTANGSTSQARMATLIITGSPGTTRNVIAPSQAKIYVVINQSNGAVVIKGAATTGVTVGAGQTAQIAWNGSDFVEIGNYVHGNFVINGNLTVNGNTTLGDAVGDTLTVNATITSNLLFTDNTYDIGASGATRPRNLFLAGNATMTGTLTVDSTTDSSSTTTGSIQTDGGLGVAKALFVGTTANIAGAVTLSGGTANGVAYLDGSKVLTTGSALTFDGTNFGVGGAASTKLHVQTTGADVEVRASTFTSGNVRFGFDASGAVYNWIQTERSSGALQFAIGNAEQMRLTSTGLGIGTSSPTQKLTVSGNGVVSGSVTVGQAGIGDSVFQVYSASYGGMRIGYNSTAVNYIDSGTLIFRDAAGSSTFATLDSSGNLGLGVTPSAWYPGVYTVMDVGAASSFGGFASGASGDELSFMATNTFFNSSNNPIYKASGLASNYRQFNGVHQWFNAPSGTAGNAITFTQAMTLDASGNLALGRTSQIDDGQLSIETVGSNNSLITTNWKNTQFLSKMYFANDYYLGVRADAANREIALIANSGDATAKIAFYTGGAGTPTERARITSGGDLLVGDTANSAGARLYVKGSGATSGSVAMVVRNSTPSDLLYIRNDGYMTFGISPAMTLDASGNLGVGTTSPANRLSVSGSTGTIASFTNGATADFAIICGSSITSLNAGGANILAFQTGGTERARIDSSGRFGIGFDSPNAQLVVCGTGASGWVGGSRNVLQLRNANSSGNRSNYIAFGSASTDANCFILNDINANGTTVNQLNIQAGASGGVFLADGGTSWTSASDERIKDIIEPISNAVNKVSTIRAVVGKYKSDADGVRRSFLIAQDVQAVFPEAVTVGTDEKQTLGLAYTEVIPLLVAAIQEQQALITSLTARVAQLEGK